MEVEALLANSTVKGLIGLGTRSSARSRKPRSPTNETLDPGSYKATIGTSDEFTDRRQDKGRNHCSENLASAKEQEGNPKGTGTDASGSSTGQTARGGDKDGAVGVGTTTGEGLVRGVGQDPLEGEVIGSGVLDKMGTEDALPGATKDLGKVRDISGGRVTGHGGSGILREAKETPVLGSPGHFPLNTSDSHH